MKIKSINGRNSFRNIAVSFPVKEEKPILPEVEVKEEEVIDNPDDGEGEG